MQLLIFIKLKWILICLVNTDQSIDSEDEYGADSQTVRLLTSFSFRDQAKGTVIERVKKENEVILNVGEGK